MWQGDFEVYFSTIRKDLGNDGHEVGAFAPPAEKSGTRYGSMS